MPFVTALSLLVMGSIVAGVTEEAAFRGYMQSPIERRYGLGLAILVNGLMFGLLHFPNHAADVLWMLPYYVAVSAVYGGLTWAADSILPALVLHAAGDVVVLDPLVADRPAGVADRLGTPAARVEHGRRCALRSDGGRLRGARSRGRRRLQGGAKTTDRAQPANRAELRSFFSRTAR